MIVVNLTRPIGVVDSATDRSNEIGFTPIQNPRDYLSWQILL
jgi:hypothetical protein